MTICVRLVIKLKNIRSLSHLVSTLVIKTGSFFGTKPLINCEYAIKLEVLVTYANTRATIIAEVRPRRARSVIPEDTDAASASVQLILV